MQQTIENSYFGRQDYKTVDSYGMNKKGSEDLSNGFTSKYYPNVTYSRIVRTFISFDHESNEIYF